MTTLVNIDVDGPICARRGDTDDAAISSEYLDDDTLQAMARAAIDVLTARQLEVFELWADRVAPAEIARYLGLNRSSIHRTLHGDPRRRGRRWSQPGAIELVARHLRKDEAFMVKAATQELEVAPAVDLSRWYAEHTLKPHLFVPLSVLMIAHMRADRKREVRVETLMELLPRAAVEQGMLALRGAGYVSWDGITCRIRRIPGEPIV